MADPPEINTFVFFDLESTGLGGYGERPRITELSLVAVHRSALQGLPQSAGAPLPRVMDKLTLCVYPMKAISPGAADITGLYNDNLLNQKDLDADMVEMICMFLRRHPPPVALVAHNGLRFDFGLLKSELQGIEGVALPQGLLCVDSLLLFQALDEEKESPKEVAIAIATHQVAMAGNTEQMHGGRKMDSDRDRNSTDVSNVLISDENCNVHKNALTSENALSSISSAVQSNTETPCKLPHIKAKTAAPWDRTVPALLAAKRKLFPDESGDQESHKLNLCEADQSALLDKGQALEAIASTRDRKPEVESTASVLPKEVITLPGLDAQSTMMVPRLGQEKADIKTHPSVPGSDPNVAGSSSLSSQETVVYWDEDSLESLEAATKVLGASPTLLKKHMSTFWELLGNDGLSDCDLAGIDLEVMHMAGLMGMTNEKGTDRVPGDGGSSHSNQAIPSTSGNTGNHSNQAIPSTSSNAGNHSNQAIPSTSANPCSHSNQPIPSTSANPGNHSNQAIPSTPANPGSHGSQPIPSTSANPGNHGNQSIPSTSTNPGNHSNQPIPSTSGNHSNQPFPPPTNANTVPSSATPQKRPFTPGKNVQLTPSGVNPTPSKRGKISYSLPELHRSLMGFYPQGSHRAEDDCLALVRLFCKVGKEALEWADRNASVYADIAPMYRPRVKKPLPQGVFPAHQ